MLSKITALFACLVITTTVLAEEIKSPVNPNWPVDIPQPQRAPGGVYLPSELSDAVVDHLNLLDEWPDKCQRLIDKQAKDGGEFTTIEIVLSVGVSLLVGGATGYFIANNRTNKR